MKKLLLTCELEYDDAIMHGDEPEHIAWLLNEALGRYLSLYSGEVGDFIGDVKVVDVTAEDIERLPAPESAETSREGHNTESMK